MSLPSHEIDEVVNILEQNNKKTTTPEGLSASVIGIKQKIMDEPDWRKRASLAALLISQEYG